MTDPSTHPAVRHQVDQLAKDVGRLRRHPATHGTSLEYLADRLAAAVHTLYWIHTPSAAQLAQDGLTIDEAIATVDRYERELRNTLNEPPR